MYLLSNCSSYPEEKEQQQEHQQRQLTAVDLQHFFAEIVLIIVVLLLTVAKKLQRRKHLKTDVSISSPTSASPAAQTSYQTTGSSEKEFHQNRRQIIS